MKILEIIIPIIVRAANIVRAGENLIRLISDIKTFLVIHDFPAINKTIEKRSEELISSVSYLLFKLKSNHNNVFLDPSNERKPT